MVSNEGPFILLPEAVIKPVLSHFEVLSDFEELLLFALAMASLEGASILICKGRIAFLARPSKLFFEI